MLCEHTRLRPSRITYGPADGCWKTKARIKSTNSLEIAIIVIIRRGEEGRTETGQIRGRQETGQVDEGAAGESDNCDD